MVEVKHDGDVALGAEGKQVLHREAYEPVIILHSQSGLAVGAQALKASGKAVKCAELVAVHTPNVDVDLVPVAWLEAHQVQSLHRHARLQCLAFIHLYQLMETENETLWH